MGRTHGHAGSHADSCGQDQIGQGSHRGCCLGCVACFQADQLPVDSVQSCHRIVSGDGQLVEQTRDPVVRHPSAVGSPRRHRQERADDQVVRVLPSGEQEGTVALSHGGDDDIVHRSSERMANGGDIIEGDVGIGPDSLGSDGTLH